MLRAMDNSGPLLSVITGVQRERASAFLMGRSPPPVIEGTGALSGPPAEVAQAVPQAETGAVTAPVETASGDETQSVVAEQVDEDADDGASDDPQRVVVADSIAAMGSLFSTYTRRTRTPVEAPAGDEASDEVADDQDAPGTVEADG